MKYSGAEEPEEEAEQGKSGDGEKYWSMPCSSLHVGGSNMTLTAETHIEEIASSKVFLITRKAEKDHSVARLVRTGHYVARYVRYEDGSYFVRTSTDGGKTFPSSEIRTAKQVLEDVRVCYQLIGVVIKVREA